VPELRVEVLPEPGPDQAMAVASTALLDHELLQVEFAGRDLWTVGYDVVDKGPGAGNEFVATVQDMDSGRVVVARGRLDDPDATIIEHTAFQRPPSEDEFAWALDRLAEHPRLGPALAAGELEAYRPMPPLANEEDPDGAVYRAVAVGLRSPAGEHRVVGVLVSDGEVLPAPERVPAPSSDDCGAPLAPRRPEPDAGARQARVRVWDGEVLVWDMVVVRPLASSGLNGSGVEIRTLDYLGRRVLHRGHVPILNVLYESDGVAAGCGPAYRDWANQEAGFGAEGEDPVAGFRLCTAPPRTILETGMDGGDFQGVALWLDGDELLIVSQLQAGWYRYVSEWRFRADGRIQPRFGFAAAKNPCTCKPHVHHAYWRLDFDIMYPGSNVVQEFNEPPIRGRTRWLAMRFEARRPRDPSHQRYWRVRHDRAGRDYSLVPGPADGTADDFGAGDVWVLRYRSDEIDDGQGFTRDPALARAGLDRFVTGEPVQSEDVVIWYGAHFRHDPAQAEPEGEHGHRVGPDLVARHWEAPELGQVAEQPTPGDVTRGRR
jgi:hypothetical protein